MGKGKNLPCRGRGKKGRGGYREEGWPLSQARASIGGVAVSGGRAEMPAMQAAWPGRVVFRV